MDRPVYLTISSSLFNNSTFVESPWGLLRGDMDLLMASLVASQRAEPPGIFFFLTCFPLLAAVKPGQACRKNDIVLEIHFPYLEMEPGVIFVPEPRSS